MQDLLVVCGSGPLPFLDQGNGKFSLNRGGFQCGQSPQGTFTHAAVADYDRDGRKSREVLLDLLKKQPQNKVAQQELEMLK